MIDGIRIPGLSSPLTINNLSSHFTIGAVTTP